MPANTLLAVPIISTAPPLSEQVRAARAAGANLVELRVDLIDDPAAVEALLAAPRELPIILTIRAESEGGNWSGTEAERISMLEKLGLMMPGYIDVEHATWMRSANIRNKIGLVCDVDIDGCEQDSSRPRNRLILSNHDLLDTPTDLAGVFAKLVATPAATIKAVFSAGDATDALRVLVQLGRCSDQREVIALAMGTEGLVSRVLARKFGAWLTFATSSDGGQSAPGQPTIATLKGLYRWDHIGARTRVFGVVGWPVSHSLGPASHNAALSTAAIDGIYVSLPVRPEYERFAEFMQLLTDEPDLDVHGLSVTMPHKEHALRWLDEHRCSITPTALACGAVNTLTRLADGTWEGHNTDGLGALAALQTASRFGGDGLCGRRVAVLGAGGVARAVVATLRQLDCRVIIYNRSHQRGELLARQMRCACQPWDTRARHVGEVLINCTSVGLWPALDDTPFPAAALDPATLVFDTIYRPARTRLLRDAVQRDCQIISGLEMFIGQAAAQFARWHGSKAPTEQMRQALEDAV